MDSGPLSFPHTLYSLSITHTNTSARWIYKYADAPYVICIIMNYTFPELSDLHDLTTVRCKLLLFYFRLSACLSVFRAKSVYRDLTLTLQHWRAYSPCAEICVLHSYKQYTLLYSLYVTQMDSSSLCHWIIQRANQPSSQEGEKKKKMWKTDRWKANVLMNAVLFLEELTFCLHI